VEGGVDRGLGGHLAGMLREALRDLLEREGIVAEEPGSLVQESRRGFGRLAVMVDGGRLAVTDMVACAELDPEDVDVGGRLAGDREGLGKTQRHLSVAQLHARAPARAGQAPPLRVADQARGCGVTGG
jgi:hypothetical protein